MSKAAGKHTWSFDRISERLSLREGDFHPHEGDRTRASVAMILNQSAHGLEVLFIQRAAHDLDPWSGHIAFPGGKLEEGEQECQAACRETLEETGIDLAQGLYLGRLSDIIGTNLPVRVSCCLFGINRLHCRPVLNEEVRDLFWVTLSDLQDRGRHKRSSVAFDERWFEVPAITLPVDDKPVLWGITYRLVMQFLSVIESESVFGAAGAGMPGLLKIEEEE